MEIHFLKVSFQDTLSKNLKSLHKKCLLKRHFYNFECFELILKMYTKNFEFKLKVSLQKTLSVFQIFRKCFLKRHFLNYLTDVEKTLLYLRLFFKLHFLKIFFNFFIIFRKVPQFQYVFESPPGVPPRRTRDHVITLLSDTYTPC